MTVVYVCAVYVHVCLCGVGGSGGFPLIHMSTDLSNLKTNFHVGLDSPTHLNDHFIFVGGGGGGGGRGGSGLTFPMILFFFFFYCHVKFNVMFETTAH